MAASQSYSFLGERDPGPARATQGVAWKVNREIVLLLGWGRAILLQLAHPLVAQAIADHSDFTRQRLSRLRDTVDAMLKLTFGTAEEAARAAQRINARHSRVRGHLRAQAGIFPSGTEYSAQDPRLLRWVHATLLDSFLQTYEFYVEPLTPQEKDQYCWEASIMESQLGIPRGYLPRNLTELSRYMDEMLASGEIFVTETARRLALELLAPAVPKAAQPAVWFLRLPSIGQLPPAIRQAYGFTWSRRHELALRLSAKLIRGLKPLSPSVFRHWPAARRRHLTGSPLSNRREASRWTQEASEVFERFEV